MIDLINDEQLEKLGYTEETFKGSRTEALLESMIFATEEMIQKETQRLMKENNLTYGEARIIATSNILNLITKGLNLK